MTVNIGWIGCGNHASEMLLPQLIRHDVRLTAIALQSHADEWLHGPGARLAQAADAAERASSWLIARKGHAQPDALTGAAPYLKLMGDLTGGWMLCRAAVIAADHLAAGEGDQDYWRTKIGLARVFGEQVLATASAQEAAVSMGALDLANITAASMGA